MECRAWRGGERDRGMRINTVRMGQLSGNQCDRRNLDGVQIDCTQVINAECREDGIRSTSVQMTKLVESDPDSVLSS
jgi:hypothetical protein